MSLDWKVYKTDSIVYGKTKPFSHYVHIFCFVWLHVSTARLEITVCCMRSRKNTTFSLEKHAVSFYHHSIHLPNFVFKSKLNLISRMIFPNQNNLQSLSSCLTFSFKYMQLHTLTYPIVETAHSGKRTVSILWSLWCSSFHLHWCWNLLCLCLEHLMVWWVEYKSLCTWNNHQMLVFKNHDHLTCVRKLSSSWAES